ncbi:tRNA-splicing endonuclease subunit sen54 [Zygosaccharomyces mellis]|uniref:tRNA-splicing endonuclease subunit sen54 n=1 Tax=Zygosaccharomyces mellis TaxID=42258 RepID=A0A4C2EB53_9SACH|nr:tRNA-splicing endonuclease subunit sen54 [Zygosaccharomyces mellis]
MEQDEEQDIKFDTTPDSDVEDDELIQDWSQAAQLSIRSSTLPKRGEKDYEPDGTNVQELLLYRARKSMFDTLSNSARGSVVKNLVKAYYDPSEHKALILKPRGNFLHTLGKMDRTGTVWLEFYEFVYLAERGTITPFYKMNDIDWINQELPLTIEDLYMLFKSQEELDKFFVFGHLKRLGFIVLSTENCLDSFFEPRGENSSKRILSNTWNLLPQWRKTLHNAIFYSPWKFWLNKHTSNSQMYQSLNQLIPSYKAPRTQEELRKTRAGIAEKPSNFPISLNVWKPRTDFKKKNPGLPDYQVVIYNKNDPNQHFPTYYELRKIFKHLDYKFEFLSEIDETWDWNDHSYHDGKLRSKTIINSKAKVSGTKTTTDTKKLEKKKPKKKFKPKSPRVQQKIRLKNGFRSFLLAVMDDGMISFVKISETDFGSENVWYVPQSAAKKQNL